MSYTFHADTVELLKAIRQPARELIFPWPKTESSLYFHYRKILLRAGLPHDRKSKFHRMRRSVASHLQAGGHNASQVLGHSSAAITKESYLDPHVVGQLAPSSVLFRPSQRQPVTTPEPVEVCAEAWL